MTSESQVRMAQSRSMADGVARVGMRMPLPHGQQRDLAFECCKKAPCASKFSPLSLSRSPLPGCCSMLVGEAQDWGPPPRPPLSDDAHKAAQRS